MFRRALPLLLGALLVPIDAAADEPPAPPPKAPMPDYDGLGHQNDLKASDVLLGVARAPLLPLYAITEFGVRRPMGALVKTAEKNHWAGSLYELFTTADGKIGIFPSAFFDFGTRPSVGFFFFWNDFLAKQNDLRFHLGTWGPTWINVNATDRYTWAPGKSVSLRAMLSRRQDLFFNGIGPESRLDHESRYESLRFDAGPALDIDGWRLSALHLAAGIRRIDYGDDGCCNDPTIQQRVDRGDYPLPPHFGAPYTTVYQRGHLVFDSRQLAPKPGTGTRIEIYGEPAFHPRGGRPESWMRWGGAVGQTVDLNGHQRNLSLTVSADFADPLLGGDVPFNEQVVLGGGQAPAGTFVETRMRGFRYGRLVDRSAATATLQYTWPIWFLLEGVIQLAAGNVFGAQLRDFEPDLLRLSGVIGVRTNQRRDAHFSILFGGGTETLREGATIESFRLAIGTTNGF